MAATLFIMDGVFVCLAPCLSGTPTTFNQATFVDGVHNLRRAYSDGELYPRWWPD